MDVSRVFKVRVSFIATSELVHNLLTGSSSLVGSNLAPLAVVSHAVESTVWTLRLEGNCFKIDRFDWERVLLDMQMDGQTDGGRKAPSGEAVGRLQRRVIIIITCIN